MVRGASAGRRRGRVREGDVRTVSYPSPPDPWSYRYHACADSEVKDLVGKQRDEALARIKDMHLKVVRVLAPDTRVLTGGNPQRLTLVIAPNGTVTRAFCR